MKTEQTATKTNYLGATHACPAWNVEKAPAGNHVKVYEYVNHRVEPVRFLRTEPRVGVSGEVYRYVTLFPNASEGDTFYTFEPLPEWGKVADTESLNAR